MTPTPTESFVPLTTALPSSGARTEFQATVLSEPSETKKFQPVAMPAASAFGTKPIARGENCQPQVSLQREGNRVTGIRVQCSCGEVIELACAYDSAAQPVAPAQPATKPQPEAVKAAPGKICKDSGKDLPKKSPKGSKVPEKGRGTSAAKRRSA
jgi:hypothetical protein